MERRTLVAAAAGLAGGGLLAACGGGGGSSGGQTPPPPPPPGLEREVSGRAVVRLASGRAGLVALDEQLVSLAQAGPLRSLVLTPADGSARRQVDAPAGWSLVDVAPHPSGEMTVVLTQAGQVRLWRLDAAGALRADQVFTDTSAPADPYYGDGGHVDPDALQPVLSRDAAHVLPLGEQLLLALRTGLNAVVAYRLNYADGVYARAWRTLVEPGSRMDGRYLTSGSYDVFGQLANHVHLHADVAADGTLAVAVVEGLYTAVFEAHTLHFGEAVDTLNGSLVTRIAADGTRLGCTVVATAQLSELHGLRAVPGGFVALGRVRSQRLPDGSGWDAWLARVAADGSGGAVQLLDVDRGDVLFDVAALPDGSLLAAGATGYTQNPAGASISEDAAPLLLRVPADAGPPQRIAVAAGPRHNQLRALLQHGGQWLMAGQRNGPGTHSGDGDTRLIRADGFVARVPGLA